MTQRSLSQNDGLNLFNPIKVGLDLYKHRYLIGQLTKRDVLLKYRGSYLGIGWSFLYPLLLLASFTFVFGKVFPTHWPQVSGREVPLGLIMYCGLIIFSLFSEVVSAAPRLIYGYQSYVKKIIFPVEILPIVLVATACIHAAINVAILLLCVAVFGKMHLSLFLLPIILLPIVLFAVGIAWIFSAAGVFIRDLIHVMPVFVQIAMFLSPVFYSVTHVPVYIRWFYRMNPLSAMIENMRSVVLWGEMPNWGSWSSTLAISFVVAMIGYIFFVRGKEEFADVL